MTDIIFRAELRTPEQARAILARQALPWVGEQLKQGRALYLTVQELEDARTLRQQAFYWAAVLKPISEQAQIEGVGATDEGWHLYYKRMFLGYVITKTKLPGKKRMSITRELASTTKQSIKRMAKYIDQVQAHAATTFGVEFSDRLPQDLRPARRRARAPVDMETGEVITA